MAFNWSLQGLLPNAGTDPIYLTKLDSVENAHILSPSPPSKNVLNTIYVPSVQKSLQTRGLQTHDVKAVQFLARFPLNSYHLFNFRGNLLSTPSHQGIEWGGGDRPIFPCVKSWHMKQLHGGDLSLGLSPRSILISSVRVTVNISTVYQLEEMFLQCIKCRDESHS